MPALPSLDLAPADDAITREIAPTHARHPDAFETVTNSPQVRGAVHDRPTAAAGGVANLTDLPLRDHAALRLLAQLRLLTYAQLRSACYPHAHPSVTRRRMAQLVRAGAITVWESPARTGGHTRFALPTPATLEVQLAALSRDAAVAPFGPLIALMLPQTTKRALRLAKGVPAPNWLPHQVEVNALVLRMRDTLPLRWLSTWDCPFPRRLASFDLPQPDYVLVEEHDAGPHLVFGEHDRGSEPIARFVERKVLLYAALAAFPEACTRYFGSSTFSVRVTVTDPVHRAPMRRLTELLEATYRAGGPDAARWFRFALAGWLHATPAGAVWLAPGDAVNHDSLRPSEHGLRPAHEP